ncbi:uncharacterized protein IUM83_14538 [Phytophthora cinnamomi]|uniref:uncharacterized protein n=1 Tax=Phytophthora cinnamomi TaxID=4785 RepID=UPI00355A2834|nr:hypothetical protein IUM83_14538 [Phytophthora cinnamomi]
MIARLRSAEDVHDRATIQPAGTEEVGDPAQGRPAPTADDEDLSAAWRRAATEVTVGDDADVGDPLAAWSRTVAEGDGDTTHTWNAFTAATATLPTMWPCTVTEGTVNVDEDVGEDIDDFHSALGSDDLDAHLLSLDETVDMDPPPPPRRHRPRRDAGLSIPMR